MYTIYKVLSCLQKEARSYLIDAERLFRLRGLAKRHISRRLRLLHHIYTWNRIVGESTYVLHEYARSDSPIDTFNHYFRPQQQDSTRNDRPRQVDPNPRLDDFLRLRPRHADSDLDIDEPKEREAGIYDIHLEDSRRFSDNFYSQIYGIPETWLSLLSQTTRLANLMDVLGSSGGGTSGIGSDSIISNSNSSTNEPLSLSSEAHEALQRRCSRLENMVCSLSMRSSRATTSDTDTRSSFRVHMIHALNAALVIFFYRRIRQVHPAILRAHVDDVISSLHEFDAALYQDGLPCPGTGWPAFVAGCEAIVPQQRRWLLMWMEKASTRSGLPVFGASKEVMMEVWRQHDEHSSSSIRCRERLPTWVEVLKQRNFWPIFT